MSTDEVRIGLISAPGAATEIAANLAEDLHTDLSLHVATVRWRVPTVVDALVHPPADDAALVAAARDRLLQEDWDLVVCLTDLPLKVHRRPVVAHASPLHGVAVVCVPALGAIGLRRRTRDTVVGLVGTLLGETEDYSLAGPAAGVGRRARELGRSQQPEEDGSVLFTARVLSGNLRLLIGMIRANQPWRLAIGLSRALTAALATGVFALVTPDIWRLSDALGWIRLSAIAVGSVAAITVALIAGAGLWERASHPVGRKQATLFNLATTATVVLGVLSLCAALLLLALLSSLFLVPSQLLGNGLGHAVRVGDYMKLVWLTSSLATLGGALGAGLESDEAVRNAAYTYRQDGD
ncbi:hypothetical protein KRR39_18210 [Nocardioides panacis]|uniref:Uncharacterized protein n=1 Tax=Nocardioides panacis TaxID=2849501 RepID=A0A975XZF1_9ACTN|nr:hypothetical protein [Nocardioides panacis]QWZ07372.1 hypothetical protein KRR39_18210 [Nocardioides panacis]